MSWPSAELCERGVDLSDFQGRARRPIVISEFVAKNPSVKKYVLRVCWPNLELDQSFAPLWDALEAAQKAPEVYLWPNPSVPLSQVRLAWKTALSGRSPKQVRIDAEWTQKDWQDHHMTPIRSITEDTRETARMAADFFGFAPEFYTRGESWWDENIRVHGWERDYLFWLSRYPMKWRNADGSYRQALNFDEMEALLPLNVSYWPGEGDWIPKENVIGWQFSDHGRLPGYDRNLDLSLWLPQEPPKPTLEQTVADHEVRIVALEAG